MQPGPHSNNMHQRLEGLFSGLSSCKPTRSLSYERIEAFLNEFPVEEKKNNQIFKKEAN